MKYPKALFPVFSLLVISCAQNQKAPVGAKEVSSVVPVKDTNAAVVKIYIEESGVILADGEAITLDRLELKLQEMENKKGIVYYSRANISADPAKEAMEVIELVMKHGLSLRFFMDKEFTRSVAFE